ncbi:MAG: fatty acid desaturase [Rhodospirillaceae bacterium]
MPKTSVSTTAAIAAGAGDEEVVLRPYQAPDLGRSLWQIVTSFGGFASVSLPLYLAVDRGWYWAIPLLTPLAAGFLIRIFIIQHDCGHGSFFRSRRANDLVGMLCSLLTLAPYSAWRRQHARHHRISNNLDLCALSADIYSSCLTVSQYQALSPGQRRQQRLLRHWFVSNLLLPPLIFLVLYRLPLDTPLSWRSERRGVYLTDLALVLEGALVVWLLGAQALVAIELPAVALASIAGVWMFSIQHRFEHTLWMRKDEWSFRAAALKGSSYLRLPPLLQWFTGNIGYHHIHHLNPAIPNYRLEECHQANPPLHGAKVLTLRQALGQWRYALWHEGLGRMVPFPAAAD